MRLTTARGGSGSGSAKLWKVQIPFLKLLMSPALRSLFRWRLTVGWLSSKAAVKSQTHTGAPAALSMWIICTRVGSASAL